MYHFRVKSAASLYKTAVSRDVVACTINETPNLLGNPSFEEGTGASPRAIASPPWVTNTDLKASSGNWFNGVPPYAGSWLAHCATNGSTFDAYVRQTVPAIPGVDYNFTLALYTVMKENNTEKYDEWKKEARLDYVKIGIDPTGGTDRTAASGTSTA